MPEPTPRNEGCEAILYDNGRRTEVPVYMGGIALVGCNNPDECIALFKERYHDPNWVSVIFRNPEETKVTRIVEVARSTVRSSEITH